MQAHLLEAREFVAKFGDGFGLQRWNANVSSVVGNFIRCDVLRGG